VGIAKKVLVFLASLIGFFVLQLIAGVFLLPFIIQGNITLHDPFVAVCFLVLVLTAVLPGLLIFYWLSKLRPYLSYIAAGYLIITLGLATGSHPQGAALICLAIYAFLLAAGFALASVGGKTLTSRSRPTPTARP
jgi:hypothetical protein